MQKTRVWTPGSRRCPGKGNGNPLQYSWPRKFQGQRCLVGYSPWGSRELDTTEWLTLSLSEGILNLPNLFPSHLILHLFSIWEKAEGTSAGTLVWLLSTLAARQRYPDIHHHMTQEDVHPLNELSTTFRKSPGSLGEICHLKCDPVLFCTVW